MLKLSERWQRQQQKAIEAKFARVVAQMRSLGESAGRFAMTCRTPGQTFTVAQIEAAAQQMVGEAKASVAAPLSGLRAGGIKVAVDLDEAVLRSAFCDGFLATLSPDAMTVEGSA